MLSVELLGSFKAIQCLLVFIIHLFHIFKLITRTAEVSIFYLLNLLPYVFQKHFIESLTFLFQYWSGLNR